MVLNTLITPINTFYYNVISLFVNRHVVESCRRGSTPNFGEVK